MKLWKHLFLSSSEVQILLYSCEMRSIILQEKNKLQVYEVNIDMKNI